MAANPLIAFNHGATESGTDRVPMAGDTASVTESASIRVDELSIPRSSARLPHLHERARPEKIPPDQRRSGYELMARETRAIQDETHQSGMLWVSTASAVERRRAPRIRACAAPRPTRERA